MDWQYQLEGVGLVALAGLFGGVIGLERELARKPAGLRTHIFVAAASALMMVAGEAIVRSFDAGTDQTMRPDPIRVIQAIAVGVSFLGAGTIIHQGGERIEGLTTAGSILFTSGLGICVATRLFLLAGALSILGVAVLYGVNWVEWGLCRLNRRFCGPEPVEESEEAADGDLKQPAPSRPDDGQQRAGKLSG